MTQTRAGKAFLTQSVRKAPRKALLSGTVSGHHSVFKTAPKPAQARRSGTKYVPAIVIAYFKGCGLPDPVLEYKFCKDRRFKSDFAWPEHNLLLEVEGGVYTHQAHGSVSGILRDMEKNNVSVSLGYRTLRILPKELCMAETVNLIKLAMENGGTKP